MKSYRDPWYAYCDMLDFDVGFGSRKGGQRKLPGSAVLM